MNDDVRKIVDSLLTRKLNRPLTLISSLAAMDNPDRSKRFIAVDPFSRSEQAKGPPNSEATDDDKLLNEVADRLDAADLEAIKADPDVKRRFCEKLRNQRELNAERTKAAEEKAAAEETERKELRRSHLAGLGTRLGRIEAGTCRKLEK